MKLVLYGEPRSKKNSMQIVQLANRASLIQSKQYREYERDCLRQLSMHRHEPIDYPVNIKATFYRSTKRRVDLTNLQAALCDVLVKCSILADDNRDIVAGMDGSRVELDRRIPRTEIEITPMEGYETWGDAECHRKGAKSDLE